ncbi:TPA: pilus assembly/adherence protein PilC [Neisseria gonorrhoeae]|uniref:PilC family type IV pilus tip adhesin n=18 Tax=Neisseria gonorrhoeae TaxID=485 RepID=UPI0001AF7EA5|nr:PilC family type IV pilus tip adhesin [Neisseria gonorrhoeae]AKP15370.1 Neisseria PilC protein [Neisseria gonorrhoeae]EEZ42846.1 pilus-associated protein [Neisseria gonorrhoeae 35/02]MBT8020401.1 pilus assembly/adherence protein PilC [Neisseria gonorrhoeae]MBT8028053.1 pilus assembly/adherence protein PilC [Neisseria gonorrhoeae]MCK2137393.1 pilus assembly/adherence protein PilC [Neisseria gonorrhoeae]
MNKTLKRRVFRHTALYAAILMFSHTGGGGQAQAQTYKYAIVMNERKQPEVKWKGQYNQSALKDKGRERTFSHTSQKNKFGITSNFISFNNNDELVSQQSGTAVFGTATYLPPYGKVSGFDTAELNKRGNAVNWIHTTRPGLAGYGYDGIRCGSAQDCPKLTYKTRFSFDNPNLVKTRGGLDRHTEPSRENSPIYKLKDHPWLGVSFNLGGEGTAKDGRSSSKLVSSFDENNSNSNQNLVYTTEGHRISLGNWQRETTAMAYYLNAKLHLLDKKQIENIAPGKTVRLGVLKPSIDVKTQNTGLSGLLNFWSKWDIKDNGQIPVKLGLPQVKAGRCINKPNPNKNTKAPSPALTAPALWFGPVQNGKVQMYSASVSTYPGSSSSRIFLQELKTQTDPARPGRHSLAALDTQNIKSREPNFNSRQTVIRLPGGVYKINPVKNGGRVAGFNGNDGKNDTFGIYKDRLVTPEADEWSEVLLPWTARYYGNDDIFKTFNQPNNKKQSDKKQYSQKYRIRTKEDDNDKPRDLGDIVNSPITAVGGYLATSANDGMVHIFKKTGTDERSYELKLSYIPGTMERKDIENQDSTLAKELRTFAEKGYVGDRYGVDGGFVLRSITDDQDRQKHFFMFGAMGLGGRGAYALDLSKIDSNPVGVSMFDVQNESKNNGVKLGYTVGTPQIGKTQNGKYAAFLASGYAAKQIASQENKTALYVYDLGNGSGSLIKKIEVQGGKGGLSSPTLVDKDLDGTVDIAYAGDRGGNMYRFDLSSDKPSEWTVRTIFQGTKPITSAPAVSRLADKRVVIFGTGSDLSEEDVVGKDQQYIYGIFDDDKGTGTVKVTVQNGTGGGLLEQTLTKENNTLFLSNNKASGGSNGKGWVVRLREGERVTVKPTVVLRTAFVTIRSYTGNDKCGAQTAILGINTADGGALTPRSARPIVPDHDSVAQYSGHKKTADGKSVPIGCMWKNGKTACPNGYVYDKPVNVRYLDEKKTDDFPVTADGDAGGSGTFKEGKKPARNNRCFSGKGVRTLLMNDLDSLDITGPMCGIKRLSWREVFF